MGKKVKMITKLKNLDRDFSWCSNDATKKPLGQFSGVNLWPVWKYKYLYLNLAGPLNSLLLRRTCDDIFYVRTMAQHCVKIKDVNNGTCCCYTRCTTKIVRVGGMLGLKQVQRFNMYSYDFQTTVFWSKNHTNHSKILSEIHRNNA